MDCHFSLLCSAVLGLEQQLNRAIRCRELWPNLTSAHHNSWSQTHKEGKKFHKWTLEKTHLLTKNPSRSILNEADRAAGHEAVVKVKSSYFKNPEILNIFWFVEHSFVHHTNPYVFLHSFVSLVLICNVEKKQTIDWEGVSKLVTGTVEANIFKKNIMIP